jgi:Pin2-interacting protein X1
MELIVTKKTLKTLGSQMNESAGSKVSSFARRHMEKLGWKEGDGLGKRGDGMKKHIKIKKKQDNEGLGKVIQPVIDSVDNVWWAQAFDQGANAVVGLLGENKKDKKRKKNKKNKDEKELQNQIKEKKRKSISTMPPSFEG